MVNIHAYAIEKSKIEIDSLYNLLVDQKLDDYGADDLIAICVKYSNIHSEKSNSFCEYVLSESIFQEDPRIQCKANLELGVNLNSQGNHKQAYQYLLAGFQIAEEIKDQRLIFDSYMKLGVYYNDRGNNVLAIQNYLLSLEMASEMKDSLLMVRPYVNLTSTYLDQNRPEKAIEYGLEGLELARSSGEVKGEGFLLNNLALAFLDENRADEAEVFLLQALEINENGKRAIRVARNHSNLCKALSDQNMLKKAQIHCEKAQNILNEHINPRSNMFHAIQYGSFFLAKKDYFNAEKQARKAIQIGTENSMTVQLAGAYELLYQLQKRSGQEALALGSYEKFVELKYGKDNNQRNAEIAILEDGYLNALQAKKNFQAEGEREILKKEKEISQNQRNLSFVIASLLIGLALLLYNRNKSQKSLNELLSDKNQKIENQNQLIQESLAEKETLLKEIHHRVKNNLQTISSLLNLQSKKITDESVLESINEGKNRVEAMSLIHQNLYQSDNLVSINMQDYFEQLLSHLSDSFRQRERDISYSIDADDIFFDVDTAIPIGLIANELISNAHKHAFDNKTEGHIQISLHSYGDNYFEFVVADNGLGIDENFDINSVKSLGLKLVRSLGVKQLKGEFKIENRNGARMSIAFNNVEQNKRA